MSQNALDDIAKVLVLTWRGINSALEAGNIARIWSLDQRWLEPQEADAAVSSLVENGWLIEVEGGLKPVELQKDLKTSLGWFPRPSNLMHPPKFQQSGQTSIPKQAIDEKEQVEKNEQSIDEFHLMISEQSGLEPQEVKRRCDRKKRVLGTVEEWLCIALVAREQGLDVTALASNLR